MDVQLFPVLRWALQVGRSVFCISFSLGRWTGITTPISIKDTRASFITNALDKNERMSFIQKRVGHATTRMIVDHSYRYTPDPDDGSRLEKSWNSYRIIPESDGFDLELIEKIKKWWRRRESNLLLSIQPQWFTECLLNANLGFLAETSLAGRAAERGNRRWAHVPQKVR